MTAQSKSSESENSGSEWLSLLDRIRQFRYALVGISIVVSMDIAFALLQRLGFEETNWLTVSSSTAFGAVVLYVVAYLFFMSALSPLVQTVVERFLSELNVSYHWNRLFPDRQDSITWEKRYSWGYNRLNEKKEWALREKDEFWMQRIAEHEAKIEAATQERKVMASMSFSCMLLLWIDVTFLGSNAWSHSIATEVFSAFSIEMKVLLWVVLVWLIAMPWWYRTFHSERLADNDCWIADPEGAKLALDAIRKAREANDPSQAIPLYRRGSMKGLSDS